MALNYLTSPWQDAIESNVAGGLGGALQRASNTILERQRLIQQWALAQQEAAAQQDWRNQQFGLQQRQLGLQEREAKTREGEIGFNRRMASMSAFNQKATRANEVRRLAVENKRATETERRNDLMAAVNLAEAIARSPDPDYSAQMTPIVAHLLTRAGIAPTRGTNIVQLDMTKPGWKTQLQGLREDGSVVIRTASGKTQVLDANLKKFLMAQPEIKPQSVPGTMGAAVRRMQEAAVPAAPTDFYSVEAAKPISQMFGEAYPGVAPTPELQDQFTRTLLDVYRRVNAPPVSTPPQWGAPVVPTPWSLP